MSFVIFSDDAAVCSHQHRAIVEIAVDHFGEAKDHLGSRPARQLPQAADIGAGIHLLRHLGEFAQRPVFLRYGVAIEKTLGRDKHIQIVAAMLFELLFENGPIAIHIPLTWQGFQHADAQLAIFSGYCLFLLVCAALSTGKGRGGIPPEMHQSGPRDGVFRRSRRQPKSIYLRSPEQIRRFKLFVSLLSCFSLIPYFCYK